MDLVEQFVSRAEAVAAKVTRVATRAEADAAVAAARAAAEAEGLSSDVACAICGIASTGTCVVATDDEETRLATMLPEVSMIVLDAASIVPDLPDMAAILRERQSAGRATYTSFITGPSRTADIERVSAIGVHGPLALHIFVFGRQAGGQEPRQA